MQDLLQFLIAVFLKIKTWIIQGMTFLIKEFFLLFIYLILGCLWGSFAWFLFSHVFPNKTLYAQLVKELYGSSKFTFLFFNALGISGQYVYRLLLSSAQSMISK
jgi:hypothetical protein